MLKRLASFEASYYATVSRPFLKRGLPLRLSRRLSILPFTLHHAVALALAANYDCRRLCAARGGAMPRFSPRRCRLPRSPVLSLHLFHRLLLLLTLRRFLPRYHLRFVYLGVNRSLRFI